MKDPLAPFQEWEGQELGEEMVREPGWYGITKTPALKLHYAGAHCTSTARVDRHGEHHPAVWIRLLVKVIGTETYHIIEGMMDADVATDFAEGLSVTASQAPLDIAAGWAGDETDLREETP